MVYRNHSIFAKCSSVVSWDVDADGKPVEMLSPIGEPKIVAFDIYDSDARWITSALSVTHAKELIDELEGKR